MTHGLEHKASLNALVFGEVLVSDQILKPKLSDTNTSGCSFFIA